MSYSIYYMERPLIETWFGQGVVRGHHAFLALVKERGVQEPFIEQEIHFKNEGFLRLKVHTYPQEGMQGDHFDDLVAYGHIGGEEKYMLDMWDRAKTIATLIEKNKVPFGTERLSDSFNCRSASIALLRSLGLEYYPPEEVNTTVGVLADILNRIGVSRPVAVPESFDRLEVI